MSMGVPAALARQLGATHVISVTLPAAVPSALPNNMFQVVNRCFQILQGRFESSWRSETDLEIAPEVRGVDWNAFGRGPQLVHAGKPPPWPGFPEFRSGSRAPGPRPPEGPLSVRSREVLLFFAPGEAGGGPRVPRGGTTQKRFCAPARW